MARGRPPKQQDESNKQINKKTQVKNNKSNSNTPYTIHQIENKWNKLFSSNSGSSSINNIFMNTGGAYINNPFVLNQRLKQLQTMSGYLKRDDIEQALLAPEFNELALRTSVNAMMNMTYPIYKLRMMYEGILTYHSYVYPNENIPEAELNTPRFKSDEKFMDMWLKKLNPEYHFRRLTSEILSEGKKAYYLRQSYEYKTGKEQVDYVYWQNLPSDWWKPIKISTNSHYAIAFNFMYFFMPGTSLSQFPPIFTKYFNEMMGAVIVDQNKQLVGIDSLKAPKDVVIEYNSNAGNMSWFYWKELPDDECFVFSFDESHAMQTSPFISLLLPAQDLATYSLLQQQLLSVPLYSIILGELKFHDDKGGKAQEYDDFLLSPDAKGLFESYINTQLPPGTSYAMTPSSSNTLFHFSEIPNANKIFLQGLQQLISNAGINGLMSTTDKPSVAQVNLAKKTEVRFIDRVYQQYEHACNIILSNMYYAGETKYRWQIKIFGDVHSDKERHDMCEKGLSLGQINLLPEYYAYHKQTLYEANNIANWVKGTGIYNKFTPLISSFNSNIGNLSKKNGRKPADENNIKSDGTAASLDSGGNTGDMRSFSLFNDICKCAMCENEINKNSETYPFCEECYESYLSEHSENEEDS